MPNPVYPSPQITVAPEPVAWPISRRSLEPPRPPRPPPVEDRADFGRPEASKPPSIAPVAFDTDPRSRADSTFLLEDTPYGLRAPRTGLAIAAGLGAIIGISCSSPRSAPRGRSPALRGRSIVRVQRPHGDRRACSPREDGHDRDARCRSDDGRDEPAARPVGTVSLATTARGHRLFVDGSVVSSGSAVVSCGKHYVKVGSRGRTQPIDVPCGGDVVLDR